jgi:hypothetical protein
LQGKFETKSKTGRPAPIGGNKLNQIEEFKAASSSFNAVGKSSVEMASARDRKLIWKPRLCNFSSGI